MYRSARQELVEEGVTDVLPILRNVFVEELESLGPVQESIGRFVVARQFLGHPVAISPWKKKIRYLNGCPTFFTPSMFRDI